MMAHTDSEDHIPARIGMPPEDSEQRTCKSHGPYKAMKFFGRWSACPACFDEAVAREAAQHAARMELERKELRMKALVNRAGIPERFADRRLETFVAESEKQAKLLTVCKSYAQKFPELVKVGMSMAFVGKPGTGKTHLAVSIAHAVMAEGYSALFMTVGDCVRRIRETWRKDSDVTENEVLNELGAVDLLILDEVGVQYGTEAEKITLFDLLNRRYENRRPTIMLSNLPFEAKPGEASLQSYLGERIIDRLRENGGKVLKFDWDSYRGRKPD